MAEALGTLRKGTTVRVIVATMPQVSSWPNCNTSPGSYGYLFVAVWKFTDVSEEHIHPSCKKHAWLCFLSILLYRDRGGSTFLRIIDKRQPEDKTSRPRSYFIILFFCYLISRTNSDNRCFYLIYCSIPLLYVSHSSAVGIATGYGLDYIGVGVQVPVQFKHFNFSISSWLAVGPIQPPIQWVPGALSPGVKRQGREADHSPPTSAEVKKTWIYTSTPLHAFMA
jgi:hypothetical protein